jgi:peptidyl-prolyl cis-trans isomerase C
VVATVGDEKLTAEDMLYVLRSQTDGNDLMLGMGLARMDLAAREDLARQMAEALLLSDAARARGYDLDPRVAYALKWDRAKALAQAYLERASEKWDLSEKACRKYYDAHPEEFVQAEAVHVRHILCETESEARSAMLEVLKTKDFAGVARARSKDPGSAERGGDLEWVERGQTAPEFDAAVFAGRNGTLAGPFKTQYGWHVVEVLERRDKKQLPFQEALPEVRQRLQRACIDEEVARLTSARPVRLDEAGLSNLGGVPVPQSK